MKFRKRLTPSVLPLWSTNLPINIPLPSNVFKKTSESCLAHIDFPAGHHKYIRTTNLLERAFVEQNDRPKWSRSRAFWMKKVVYNWSLPLWFSQPKMATRLNGEYDLVLLKDIRKLYGFKEDEKRFISMKLAVGHFQFYREKYLTPPVLLWL